MSQGQDPRADVVAGQYQRWDYPEPIEDLPGWLTMNWQWFDPSHAHRMFWPDRDYRPGLQILVAGCGTNQAAVLAYTNPSAQIVAVDVSQPSLDHHAHLKRNYGLDNLELHLLPIEEVASLDRDFDLIVSTGVLHHLADPQAGMDALASLLRPDGVLALMLYARYGRIGVEMMQGIFRELGLHQDDAGLSIVKNAVSMLGAGHPLFAYLETAPDLGFDAGLVDTFLHGRDRSFTVDDCLELVAKSGLVFQEWFLKSPYEPDVHDGNAFLTTVAALPDAQRWSVMERVNTRNACHFFTACRADRPTPAYRIDFSSDAALAYVPELRYRCSVDGHDIVRPGWRMALDPDQRAFAQRIDGRRSIGEIIDRSGLGTAQGVAIAKALWNRDFLAFGITAS